MKVVKVISAILSEQGKFLMTKLLKSGKSDVQEVKTASIPGIDSFPLKDDIALYETTEINGENFVIGFLVKDRKSKEGEVRIYSRDPNNGSEKIYMYVTNTGEIHFGGNSKHLTRYEELKTGFDELKSDFNDLVTKFNTHIHPAVLGTAPVTVSPTATQDAPSTADISGSKINELKTL